MKAKTILKKEPANKKIRKETHSQAAQVRGADLVIQCLEHEGVEVIFAYPGGASMELHQSLRRSTQIRTVLPRHEQGGIFAAEGYARATGKAGVCMTTSGPGATNLITGLADAYLDSVPLVAITGQVASHLIGKSAFQETDMFGMTLPVVKHSYLVTSLAEVPRVIKEAFYIAQSGRPGPVLIDLPKDIQQSYINPVFPDKVTLRGYQFPPKPRENDLLAILEHIRKSERPVIYAGGGVITSGSSAELIKFVEKTHIPVATTLMGCGAFPETHPLSLKWLGMHGCVAANNAVNEADLVLAFGVRFDDRVTGKVEKFAEHATIVHIDIDNSELNKNRCVHLPIQANLRDVLKGLNRLWENPTKGSFKPWLQRVAEWKKEFPLKWNDSKDVIQPQYAIRRLYELTGGDAIITTGVGQHQMWAGQFYDFTSPRTLITSAGLGSMGFGFPAAIGAKVAYPNKQVVDIDGDGSFLMNIQELATAHIENIPVKAMILNNQHLGMVVQWEDRFYQSIRGHTFLGDPQNPKRIYPDYPAICAGFGVKCERVSNRKDLDAAIQRMLDSKEAYVLDILTPYTEHVLPFIPAGKTYRDIIID